MTGIKVKSTKAHNVYKLVAEGEETYPRNDPSKMLVHPHTKLLIDKLLLRNPAWEFRLHDYPSENQDGYVYSRFEIESDGERLGWAGSEKIWRNGSMKYEFDCDRLRLKRQTSATPHTKDLNKAAKAILANMYNKTPAERTAEAIGRVRSVVGGCSQEAQRKYATNRERLVPHMVSFVEDRWEEFAALPLDNRDDTARAELMSSKYAYLDTVTISEPLSKNEGKVLIDTGSAYIVSTGGAHGTQSTVEVKRLDELDDRTRGSLGILKLLDPKMFAAGIGMRVDPMTYYVVDTDK